MSDNRRMKEKDKIWIALVVLIVITVPVGVASEEVLRAPELSNIHLTWKSDPCTTMVITWQSPFQVDYKPTVEYGLMGSYGLNATGRSHAWGDSMMIHEVELTGLTLGTTYHYRCGSPSWGWSGDYTFTTLSDHPTFVVWGDTRNDINPFYGNNDFSITGQISKRIAEEQPDFCLFGGDFLYFGWDQFAWNRWFMATQQLNVHVPIVPVLGNHDEVANYFEQFSLPGNERWYSLNMGDIHLICLDTGPRDNAEQELIDAGSPQHTWLVNDLEQAHNKYDWIIVQFHRPPYGTGGHFNATDVQEAWCPLFDQYGVDLVFCSHNHFYERTYPMRGHEPVDRSVDRYPNVGGTIYVTTGGGGAPLCARGEGRWVVTGKSVYHYVVVRAAGKTLHVQAKDIDGTIIDDFWLSK